MSRPKREQQALWTSQGNRLHHTRESSDPKASQSRPMMPEPEGQEGSTAFAQRHSSVRQSTRGGHPECAMLCAGYGGHSGTLGHEERDKANSDSNGCRSSSPNSRHLANILPMLSLILTTSLKGRWRLHFMN